MQNTPRTSRLILSKPSAVKFVVLLGAVSLLADMTYEGARSITGPYLAFLGASATVVGIVSGLGELIGYGIRLVSGYLSDRTERYWFLTLLGYSLNLLAVPLLAFAGSWELAALLIVVERFGKGIRTPPRDAMLSHATQQVGHGWGFGLHEAMDQIGALAGPLTVALVLFLGGNYRYAFAFLFLPAFLALTLVFIGRFLYPYPHQLEVKEGEFQTKGFPRVFWIYLTAVAFIAAGYADFPLIAYHFEKTTLVSPNWIPLFYGIAMGADALSALFFGRLFDRFGLSVLIASTLLSVFFPPLAFLGGPLLALIGVILWGIGIGAQESIMRSAIAVMIPPERRGSGYGLFNTGYGLFWFLGSALMGVLYDTSLPMLVLFSMMMQGLSLPFFFILHRERKR